MHPYCGKTCARSSCDSGFPNSHQGGSCKINGCDKPCYVEPSGVRHPYCSRTCAKKDLQNSVENKTTQEYNEYELLK
ncbi:1215_t:CDS:2, partial [Scutellospora calospora]